MYKSAHLIIFVCLAFNAVARPEIKSTNSPMSSISTPDEKMAYSEVVDCGSVAQADLFRRARLWILQSAPEDKMLLNDKETGDIVSHVTQTFTLPRSENFSGGVFTVSYALTVECANRKYRASISNIEVFQSGNTRTISFEEFGLQNDTATKQFQSEVDSRIKAKMADLKLNVKDYKPF